MAAVPATYAPVGSDAGSVRVMALVDDVPRTAETFASQVVLSEATAADVSVNLELEVGRLAGCRRGLRRRLGVHGQQVEVHAEGPGAGMLRGRE